MKSTISRQEGTVGHDYLIRMPLNQTTSGKPTSAMHQNNKNNTKKRRCRQKERTAAVARIIVFIPSTFVQSIN